MAINQYSLSSFPIIIQCTGNIENHGTAFYYEKNNKLYLITNWHNFSGRNPKTGQPLDNDGATPRSIVVLFHTRNQLGNGLGANYDLYSSDNVPLWKQHKHGQIIDIAIIEILPPENGDVYPINKMPGNEDMRIEIGMDVFVLGFPIKFFTGIFPVWKRATIATEYDLGIEGNSIPRFLVDTASRRGMSGSPVILRQRGGYIQESGNQRILPGTFTRFLGVYSGRYGVDDDNQAQLGIVWQKRLIDEVIDEGVPGNHILL